jgi:DNA modification methylase
MADTSWSIIQDDCIEAMRAMPAVSVDAIVTDPPYGLGFMGKAWDDLPPSIEWAAECLRVLKPGGHLLAFGGTRTYHRLACAIEDAGFEIRDTLCWLQGAGFPKSLNIDRDTRFCHCTAVPYSHARNPDLHGMRDAVYATSESCCEGQAAELLAPVQRSAERSGVGDARSQGASGLDGCEPCELQGKDDRSAQSGMEGRRDLQAPARQPCGSEVRTLPDVGAANGPQGRLRDGAPPPDGADSRASADANGGSASSRPQSAEQPPIEPGAVANEPGAQDGGAWPLCSGCGKPHIPSGLGTALKPAHEPIVVARKPLNGTVAANVLAHGTGAINVDGCRIETDWTTDPTRRGWQGTRRPDDGFVPDSLGVLPHAPRSHTPDTAPGRWPANVVLDETAAAMLDAQTGSLPGGTPRTDAHGATGSGVTFVAGHGHNGFGDQGGGASRFLYVAKASSAERNAGLDGFEERTKRILNGGIPSAVNSDPRGMSGGGDRQARNVHPTVKPIALMRWLVRLVTPPGGTVLDPFAGSGTTGAAAMLEGFDFVGIEREAEYVAIAEARIAWWARHTDGMTLVKRLEAAETRAVVAASGQTSMFDAA